MITNDTIWSERQTPIDVTTDTTTVTLQDGISLYQVNLGAIDTEIVFSTAAIDSVLQAGEFNVISFELLVVMPGTVRTIDFPATVGWLDDIPPTMNAPNKSYLILFRSYDGGASWIGAQEGSF